MEMRRAGAAALEEFRHLDYYALAEEVYRAMLLAKGSERDP
jgi:hypothetical protein